MFIIGETYEMRVAGRPTRRYVCIAVDDNGGVGWMKSKPDEKGMPDYQSYYFSAVWHLVPKQREWWINEFPNDRIVVYSTKSEAIECCGAAIVKALHVREVIDDEPEAITR